MQEYDFAQAVSQFFDEKAKQVETISKPVETTMKPAKMNPVKFEASVTFEKKPSLASTEPKEQLSKEVG